MKNEVLVSIRCLVYNHEPYLRQCLDGIVMQKTNFKFEAIVHDDASTDNSANIIKEYAEKYPDIIKPIYETENQHSKHDGSINLIINNAISKSSKYVAMCEGDDYWIDPLKLQKQVDFLDNNPDYSMCYHPVYHEYDGKILSNDKRFDNDSDISTEQLIQNGGGFCATCSLFYRSEYYKEMPNFRKIANIGDWPLQILMGIKGKVRYLSEIMAVYRKNNPGSWTSRIWNTDRSTPYQKNIKWLMALNKETKRKYEKSIIKVIMPFTSYLLEHHKINDLGYVQIYRNFKLKNIIEVCGWKSAVFVYAPSLYHAYKYFFH